MRKNRMGIRKLEAQDERLLAEVLEGLGKPQKQLPCKLLYDEKGSELFDEICRLEEYYLTRTEISIMNDNIAEISEVLGKRSLLIELGSGSSIKIRLLLDYLEHPAGYMPIDISSEHLMKSVKTLARDYPNLKIVPVCADYTQPFDLPKLHIPWSHRVIYYPGSSIGNFTPEESIILLKRVARLAGKGGSLLIGGDLKKGKKTLEAAYNDKMGVTAAFNLNMLERLNRELGADFDLNEWRHYAFYNDRKGRVEIYLISRKKQYVHIDDTKIFFEKGEAILTEYSYKYTTEEFAELASGIFQVERVWMDIERKFSVQYLSVV